jgi:hypothetical protein
MDIFYIIVLSVAIVILILILTYIGINSMYNKSGTVYPPKALPCPDTWQTSLVDSSSCSIPVYGSTNTGSIYDSTTHLLTLKSATTPGLNTNSSYISFTDSGWTKGGVSAICGQKLWAIKNNITWDGVSNYNKC